MVHAYEWFMISETLDLHLKMVISEECTKISSYFKSSHEFYRTKRHAIEWP